MTDIDLSRRELLAGAATGGGLGILLGSGTVAMLSDEESFPDNLLTAGALDLEVVVDVEEGEEAHSEGIATVPVELDDETRAGSATLSVRVPDLSGRNNPAYAWLQLACPPDSPLAAALSVTLRYDCGGGTGDVLASGPLIEVADELRNGVPLSPECDAGVPAGGQGCLQPTETLPLVLEWTLADDYTGQEALSLPVAVVGRQCRHQDGTTNPFTPPTVPECSDADHHAVSFVEIYRCGSDGGPVFAGKLELDGSYCGQDGVDENTVDPGRYDLHGDGDDCTDTGFDVRVTDTETKSDGDGTETAGIAFELLEDGADDGPELCEVVVAGGPAPDDPGPAEAVYDDPSTFEGNATDGLLFAPETEGDS